VVPPSPPAGHLGLLLAAVVGAVAVLAVVAGLGIERPGDAAPGTPPPAPTLAVVGDSISFSALYELAGEGRRAGWPVALEAVAGAMAPDMQAAAARLAGRRPAAAVIHLGTNDAVCLRQNAARTGQCRLPSYDRAGLRRELTVMARTLRDAGSCVVGIVPFLDEGAGAALDALRAEGTVTALADWRAEARAHRRDWVADEYGHLSDAGRGPYARFVVDSAVRACGWPPPAITTLP
jgi:hypothetical protein